MDLSKPNPSDPSSTRIVSKFVNQTNAPMDAISFQVRQRERESEREREREREIACHAKHCHTLSCTVMHYPVMHYPFMHYPALSCTILSCTILHCHALSCTILHDPALSCTILHYPARSCTVMHYPALSCTILSVFHPQCPQCFLPFNDHTSYPPLTLCALLRPLCPSILNSRCSPPAALLFPPTQAAL
jgi:hypothetical protein